jgi:hypothetical protein
MNNRQRRASSGVRGALVICSLALSFQLMAQQEPRTPTEAAAPNQAKTGEKTEGKKDSGTRDQSRPQDDRLFWALPNLLTVENASHVPPLTSGQKFKLVARSTFDRAEYPWIGLVALIGQATDSDPAFGQGFRGYAKRYGTAFGDVTIGNFMTNAVFPSLLRQDPRYYQLGKGGFFRRAAYAGGRILVTRTDSGQKQFNFSELLGNAMTAGISNAYHPAPRTLASNVRIWWTQIAWDAVAYELKEFWPDIRRRIHKP